MTNNTNVSMTAAKVQARLLRRLVVRSADPKTAQPVELRDEVVFPAAREVPKHIADAAVLVADKEWRAMRRNQR